MIFVRSYWTIKMGRGWFAKYWNFEMETQLSIYDRWFLYVYYLEKYPTCVCETHLFRNQRSPKDFINYVGIQVCRRWEVNGYGRFKHFFQLDFSYLFELFLLKWSLIFDKIMQESNFMFSLLSDRVVRHGYLWWVNFFV